jgi:hypothetical protein
VLAVSQLPCACTAAEVVRISDETLMHMPDLDQEAGCCPGNGLHCLA